jgi:disulfide bond formation protein DsbB
MEQKSTNYLLQYGLLSAVTGILFFVIMYLGGVKTFTSPVAYLGFVIPIIFAVIACRQQKKADGGYLEFSKALKIAFGVMVISGFVASIIQFIFFNYIDTAFRESMLQESMNMAQKMMEKFNVPQDQIDKQLDEMTKTNQFSFGKTMLSFAFACILWFIIALIIAAIVKKKAPEFPTNQP